VKNLNLSEEIMHPSYIKPKDYNHLLKLWLKKNPWVKVGYKVEFPIESKVLGTLTEIKDCVYINGPMVIKGSGKVTIGKYSVIAENFRIISSNHRIDRADMQGKFTIPSDISKGPIYIGNNVWCGDNVTILSGVTIGDGAVIGAGSIVTRDIPPFSVAVGIPAKVIKYRFSKKVIEKLQEFNNFANKIYLVTMRNNEKNLLQQLETLKVKELFDKIIVCKSKTENPKYNALKKIKFNTAVIIGDTEEDTKTAKKLGIKCIGITNGLRLKKLLDADYFVDELCNISFSKL